MTELLYSLCQERDLSSVALWGGHLMIWRVTLRIVAPVIPRERWYCQKKIVVRNKYSLFEQICPIDYHRGRVKYIINNSITADCRKISHFLRQKSRDRCGKISSKPGLNFELIPKFLMKSYCL